jgi:hypothetical protein
MAKIIGAINIFGEFEYLLDRGSRFVKEVLWKMVGIKSAISVAKLKPTS